MIRKILLVVFVLFIQMSALAQYNPVQNLTFNQTYVNMQNYFQLNWEEPAQPHAPLAGYNIYRNGELYRFQTETSLYYINSDVYGLMTNCGIDFLFYNNPNQQNSDGFDIYVTAVYDPDKLESDYTQTCHSFGAALNTNSFAQEKAMLYPNPTSGILNMVQHDVEQIIIYDVTGKVVKTVAPATQIDLSDLLKGFYVVKLYSGNTILVDKIMLR